MRWCGNGSAILKRQPSSLAFGPTCLTAHVWSKRQLNFCTKTLHGCCWEPHLSTPLPPTFMIIHDVFMIFHDFSWFSPTGWEDFSWFFPCLRCSVCRLAVRCHAWEKATLTALGGSRKAWGSPAVTGSLTNKLSYGHAWRLDDNCRGTPMTEEKPPLGYII